MTSPQNNEDNNLQYIGFENINNAHIHTKHGTVVDESTNKKNRQKRSSATKKVIIILFVIFCILAILFIALFTIALIGRHNLLNADTKLKLPGIVASEDDGMTISYQGKTYLFNKNVTAILCMGIDNTTIGEASSYGANGQSDVNMLVTIDTQTGKTRAININRDTLVNVKNYSKNGEYISSEEKQLCLAYATADGKELSCKNMVESVSELLYGIPIKTYYAIDLDALGPINDSVGGITVTPTEDFRAGDYFFHKSRPTFLKNGKMVEAYIRYRDTSVLTSNLPRIERQKEYLNKFVSAATAKTKQDITYPLALHNALKGNNINNITIDKIAYLTTVYIKNHGSFDIVSIDGEVSEFDGKAAFTPDEENLFEAILDVFYIEQ